jgi:hypothetical protein
MVKKYLSENDKTYWPYEGTENLEEYCEGGFHPVHLRDEYPVGRYKRYTRGANYRRRQIVSRFIPIKVMMKLFLFSEEFSARS